MSRCFFSIKLPLNCDSAFLADQELPPPVWRTVDSKRDSAFARLVRVTRFESLQRFANLSVLVHRNFDVGPLKLRLVVVDVSQLDHYPRVRHMVLVIVVVFTLRTHSLSQKNFDRRETKLTLET